MKNYDKISTLLWNASEDDYSVALYRELIEINWSVDDIFIGEDKAKWLSIDARVRKDIIVSLFVSRVIERAIGTVLLPVLIEIVGVEFATRRAMLSTIAARLNGSHAQLSSKMITDLNPQTLINNSMKNVSDSEKLKVSVSGLEALFQSVRGWELASRSGIADSDLEAFDNLNLSIWKACSVATVMLEVSQTTPTVLTFNEMSDVKLDNILHGYQVLLKDRTIISSYLALIARSKLMLLPKEEQEKAREWTENYVKVSFTDLWSEVDYVSSKSRDLIDLISDYGYYNINKALTKLELPTIYDQVQMPYLIQSHLKVDLNIYKYMIEKETKWFRWRK